MRDINDIEAIIAARQARTLGVVFEEDDDVYTVVLSTPTDPTEDDEVEDKSDNNEDNIEEEE